LALLAAATGRLCEYLQGFLHRQREELRFGFETPPVVAPLDVRAVATVQGQDLDSVGVRAYDSRERQELEGVVETERVQVHALEERGSLGLFLGAFFLLSQLDVGSEAAGSGIDRQPGLGVGAQDLVPA